MPRLFLPSIAALLLSASMTCAQQTLHVGPDQPFVRLEAALAAAKAGDTILVHPLPDNRPYAATALSIKTPRLTIRAATFPESRISLTGTGFDYSGTGSVPRAIIQFNPGADNCTIEGFEFSGAHNASHNGAGLRINQANHITIRSCTIHDNDMGIMSNGNNTPASALDQRIEYCLISHNGSAADPGQNHNLYLGGTSAILTGCEVHSSTTGHNVKSRAHSTRIEYCYIHDSASREFDLVDAAGDTDTPASDVVILGCIISKKSPDMSGNRAVIHFGQDGGHDHNGTLYIANSTIITPYVSPVVTLSAPGAKLSMMNTLISDGDSGQHHQVLLDSRDEKKTLEALAASANGTTNAHRGDFIFPLAGVLLQHKIEFANPAAGDFRIISPAEPLLKLGSPISKLMLPAAPGQPEIHPGTPFLQYKHPQSTTPRADADAPCLGACEPSQPAKSAQPAKLPSPK